MKKHIGKRISQNRGRSNRDKINNINVQQFPSFLLRAYSSSTLFLSFLNHSVTTLLQIINPPIKPLKKQNTRIIHKININIKGKRKNARPILTKQQQNHEHPCLFAILY